jgi:hypothetical protein
MKGRIEISPKSLAVRVARWYIFKPKNPSLGKFWRVLEWKRMVYVLVIRNKLQPFGTYYGQLVIKWKVFGIFSPFCALCFVALFINFIKFIKRKGTQHYCISIFVRFG